MKESKKHHKHDDRRNADQDEPQTTNEIIREAHGDPNMNLEDLNEGTGSDLRTSRDNVREGGLSTDVTRGVDYTPNDASAVRSGGTTDMDDQTGSSMGLQSGTKRGFESGIAQKRDVTGSDYDGQNSTSNP